jgi:hypothetical protein
LPVESYATGEEISENPSRCIRLTVDENHSEIRSGRIAVMSEVVASSVAAPASDAAACIRREEIIAAYRWLVEVRRQKLVGIVGAFLRSHPATEHSLLSEHGADDPS